MRKRWCAIFIGLVCLSLFVLLAGDKAGVYSLARAAQPEPVTVNSSDSPDGVVRADLLVPTAAKAMEPPSMGDSLMLQGKEALHELTERLQSAARRAGKAGKELFQLTQIQIDGNDHVSRRQIIRATGFSSRPWLWRVSLDDIRNRVRSLAWVDDVRVHFSMFPNKLLIEVSEAEPWIVAELSGESWLVSKTGRPLQPLATLKDAELIIRSTTLPRLAGIDEKRNGTPANPGPSARQNREAAIASNTRFGYAVRLVRTLDAAGGLPFAIERYELSPEGSLVATPADRTAYPEVVLGAANFKVVDDSLNRLRAVLADQSARGLVADRIDLRFDNQAVLQGVRPILPPEGDTEKKSR